MEKKTLKWNIKENYLMFNNSFFFLFLEIFINIHKLIWTKLFSFPLLQFPLFPLQKSHQTSCVPFKSHWFHMVLQEYASEPSSGAGTASPEPYHWRKVTLSLPAAISDQCYFSEEWNLMTLCLTIIFKCLE